jgi:hypothetical protein
MGGTSPVSEIFPPIVVQNDITRTRSNLGPSITLPGLVSEYGCFRRLQFNLRLR